MKAITKEEFWAAYNKFPPNGFIKFAYKYFSKETKKEDLWLKNTFVGVEVGLFLIGMIGTILELNKLIVGIATIAFSALLALLVIYLFTAVIVCNNSRIRKIRKELGGISKIEYNKLVEMFS